MTNNEKEGTDLDDEKISFGLNDGEKMSMLFSVVLVMFQTYYASESLWYSFRVVTLFDRVEAVGRL